MYKKLLTIALFSISSTIFAADIFKADRHFTEKNYSLAKQEYLKAAKVGNPHAYYQLANMYYKGLGGEQDIINALIYFDLAAEHDFHNTKSILDSILNSIPAESRDTVLKILDDNKQSHGKQKILDKYFPIIDEKTLSMKVTFDGEATIETVYHQDDIDLESLNPELDGNDFYDENGDLDSVDDSLALLISTPKTPFLVVDHDINPDGSVRYVSEVQKFGLYKDLLEEFKLFPLAKPEFDGKPIDFISRTYLGAAAYSKFTLARENERKYQDIIRQVRRFRNSEAINDQFNLAMIMLNFPWVEQEENEPESILLSLAKKGHSPAMYEYGLKLYREQRDIKQAIHWISEASKYGLIRAEYRLGKILQTSPWVLNDERKALFWYQSAMEKGDVSARIRAIDILLTTKDESLKDVKLATEYLAPLAESQSRNPEYFYLTALSYRYAEQRQFKLTVDNLERAILTGQMANWDVSEWQDLLARITTGSVYISDEPE